MSETQTYIERLSDLRANVLKTLERMNARGLNWKPTPRETNSPYVLAAHLIGSERHWLHRMVGQREVHRDRAAEFRARGATLDALRAKFQATAGTSAEILARLSASEMDARRETPNYGVVTVRWCIVHMIEHYSEHLGHIQLTRQMWEAGARKGGARKTRKSTKAAKKVKREK